MRRFLSLLVLMSLVVLVNPGSAQEDEEKAVDVLLHGYYRARGITVSNIKYVDPESSGGTVLRDNRNAYIQQRLRLEPELKIAEKLSIKLQADVFDDVIWGDSTCYVDGVYDPTAPGCVLPALAGGPSAHGQNFLYRFEDRMLVIKRAWVEATTGVGKFVFGRMPSHWGLGILENDGNGFRNEWGDAHYGDNRDRIEFVTKPGGRERPYYLTIGYDKTVEGVPGEKMGEPMDDVDQWFIVPFYCAPDCLAKPPQVDRFIGAFIAYRVQPSTDTKVLIPDAYIMYKFLENFKIEFDLLYIGGVSEALDADDDGIPDKSTVNVLNALLRGTYDNEPLKATLEVGYAGGDKDGGKKDRRIGAFTWDPDYNVGLLMFEELVARQSSYYAQWLAKQTDAITEELIPLVATKGGVKNATYVMLTPKFYISNFAETKLSILWATLNERVMGPLVGNNYLNYAGNKKDLGIELDWGLEVGANLKTGVQIGYFWPGRAFDDQNGNRHPSMFTAQLRLTVPF